MSEYEDRLEQQARQYVAKIPLSFHDTRELLILSAANCCHTAHAYFDSHLSDLELLDCLLSIISDADGFFSGDARRRAAYYLGRFDPALLNAHSDDLLSLYDAEDGEGAGGCLRGLLLTLLPQRMSKAAKSAFWPTPTQSGQIIGFLLRLSVLTTSTPSQMA